MPILESPTGPYAVGAVTFTLPVRPTRIIGGAAVRTETGETVPALRLEEVSFTAYYPVSPNTTESRWNWLNWFPRPLAETVRGYSHFSVPRYLHSSAMAIGTLFWVASKGPCVRERPTTPKNQGHMRGPNCSPEQRLLAGVPGLWLSSLMDLVGAGRHIASSGKVVLALEHRDGTCPITWPLSGETGKRYPHFYVKPDDVIRDNREVYLTYSAFRELVQTGERGDLQTMDASPFDWASWAGDWVRYDEGVSLVGHSFGGATVFAMLSLKEEDDLRIPVSHGLASHSGQNTSSASKKWCLHGQKAPSFTIIRGQHNSFSDLPVMPPVPIRKSTARPIMNVIKTLTLSFLDDQLPSSVNRLNVRKLEIEYPKSRPWSKNPKRRLVGNAGDIIIHRFDVVE
ncbi:hypothetical protein EDB83DRAFT_2517349 [Lactarius deliciosus]|nr:hypothetical protein EDB83DRAFT_2517349 [Lactarius deliciosus]